MNGQEFIKQANAGRRDFSNEIIDEVDPDKLTLSSCEMLVVNSITLTHYDINKHVSITARNMQVNGNFHM